MLVLWVTRLQGNTTSVRIRNNDISVELAGTQITVFMPALYFMLSQWQLWEKWWYLIKPELHRCNVWLFWTNIIQYRNLYQLGTLHQEAVTSLFCGFGFTAWWSLGLTFLPPNHSDTVSLRYISVLNSFINLITYLLPNLFSELLPQHCLQEASNA